jgi:hypothetical protein
VYVKEVYSAPPIYGAGNVALRVRKGGYDLRSVLRWEQMMALSLLEVFKAVEKRFGEEGQKICVETLVDVGKQA